MSDPAVEKIPSSKTEGILRKLWEDDRRFQAVVLAAMLVWYGFLLLQGVDHASGLNLTFNSMLQHLVHGRFDVDPSTVGDEGFLRNGRVYAYWGIFCALLRLPLLALHRMDLDVTVWSCLAGVCLAGMAKLKTVLLIRRHAAANRNLGWALGLTVVYVVLGGSEIAYLRAAIFQEVVFWAVAFAAVFVYLAFRGMLESEFSTGTLGWMAAMAGLALLTRVSTGIGLITALLLLLAVLAVKQAGMQGWARTLTRRRFLVPVAVLAAGLAMTATVNDLRWGHPQTFADYRFYLMNQKFPDRMPRTREYGYFNVKRIPFGLSYYFAPLWVLRGNDGRLLFEDVQTRMMDAVELPPSSFFLTDLYPMALIVLLAAAMRSASTRRKVPTGELIALAAGLAVPCLLMLTAISMNYRYRMEFYPEIDLLAFAGLWVTVKDSAAEQRFTRWRRWMAAAATVSVAGALAVMILYKASDWGPSQRYLRNGVVSYYRDVLSP
jgi:hypothetical protein